MEEMAQNLGSLRGSMENCFHAELDRDSLTLSSDPNWLVEGLVTEHHAVAPLATYLFLLP